MFIWLVTFVQFTRKGKGRKRVPVVDEQAENTEENVNVDDAQFVPEAEEDDFDGFDEVFDLSFPEATQQVEQEAAQQEAAQQVQQEVAQQVHQEAEAAEEADDDIEFIGQRQDPNINPQIAQREQRATRRYYTKRAARLGQASMSAKSGETSKSAKSFKKPRKK